MAMPTNWLELIGSWLTPTILFCILNLTIITIFILNPKKQQQSTKLVRVPSLFERITSINLSMYQSEPQQVPNQLVRVPSLLERVKSIKFRTEPKTEEEPVHVERTKSETVKKKVVKKKLRKSVSEKLTVETDETTEKLRPATVREKTTSYNEDEAVDEKADDFINRFRQQLKLQRLDSILRYKEMLNRGTEK